MEMGSMCTLRAQENGGLSVYALVQTLVNDAGHDTFTKSPQVLAKSGHASRGSRDEAEVLILDTTPAHDGGTGRNVLVW